MRKFLVLIMLVSIAAASNYIQNGDFEQAINIGWTQIMAGGGTIINRGTTYHPDSDYEIYVYKSTGTTGYAQLWQIAEIPTCNIDLSFSAKLYAWDNYNGAWAGAAVRIEYLDNSNVSLGETRVCRWSYDCPWTNAADCHIIQVTDSSWHDYDFNLLDELNNVPAVNPDEVAKIKITLNAQVVHCWGASEQAKVFADDFVLGYEGSDPYLVFVRSTVYDAGGNNNGRLDPGESIDLTSTLVNIGGADITSLNTTIQSSDPYITITDNAGYFGSLPVDSVKENTGDPYVLSSSASAPHGYSAAFTLIATGDGGFADTSYFDLCIGQDAPTDTGHYYAYYSGGPHPHCPSFDWIAIDTTQSVNVGTSLDLLDNQNALVNLPFNFTYYGTSYNSISVGSNGFITMGYTTDVDWSNTGIPSADGPPAMIAPYWSDLDPGNAGAPSDIYWYYDQPNNRFIIEYFQVEHWPSGSHETFEVILYDPVHYPTPTGDGEIVVQYLVPPQTNIGTIGIENSTETVGIEYYYNDDYNQWAIPVTANFAIKYTTHDPTPGINEFDEPTPVSQPLLQVSPNPCRLMTTISFSMAQSTEYKTLHIFDAAGRLVKSYSLESIIENQAPEVVWDGTDQANRKVPEGVYFAHVQTSTEQATAKIIMVK